MPQGPDLKTQEIGPKRVEALTVHDGFIYASSYDGGHVHRFDGKTWTDCGQIGDNTTTGTASSSIPQNSRRKRPEWSP